MALEDIGVRAVIENLGAYLAGMGDMQKSTDKTSAALEGLAQASKVPTGPMKDLMSATQKTSGAILFGLVGAFTGAIAAGEGERKSIAQLENTLKNAGIAYANVAKEIEKVTTATIRKTGISDEAQRSVLNQLVLITGDYKLALQALPVVLDLAAAKGMDVTSAAVLMGKALNGNTEALTRYGIVIPQGATALEALAAIQDKVKGSAEAMAGPMDKLKGQMGELADQIGGLVLPAFTAIVDKVTPIIAWMGKWMDQNPILAKLIVGVAAATMFLAGALFLVSSAYLSATVRMMAHLAGMILMNPALIVQNVQMVLLNGLMAGYAIVTGLVTAATWAWAAAQAVLDVLLSPVIIIIGLIVLAIAALIVIIVLLIKHWDDVVKFMRESWDRLLGVFESIKDAFKAVWDFIVKLWNSGVNRLQAIWERMKAAALAVPNAILAAYEYLQDKLLGIFEWIANTAIDTANAAKTAWNWLTPGSWGDMEITKHVNLTGAAYGGYFPNAQPVMVGERGPEVVMMPAGATVQPNTYNTNYNVNANYSKTQTPVTLAMDLESIRMRSR